MTSSGFTTKKIIVCSSMEGCKQAEALLQLLGQIPGVQALYWKEVFLPSELTLSAIEKINDTVTGALLIATPDDHVTIRGEQIYIPRTNVIFELGLFSARLGRSNVALCKFEGVRLPTDLESFTYIPMGAYEAANTIIKEDAQAQIRNWITKLWPLPSNISRTRVYSGFSGVWKIMSVFSKWRGYEINATSSVLLNASLTVFSAENGKGGYGVITGELEVSLKAVVDNEDYHAKIRLCDKVVDFKIQDGTIEFTSETFSRQIVSESRTVSGNSALTQDIVGIKRFEWRLQPVSDVEWLGNYRTAHTDLSYAEVRAWKVK